MLSVIIPAFNEELSVQKAYDTISKILDSEKIENEIIFIDDGSTDRTYEKISEIADGLASETLSHGKLLLYHGVVSEVPSGHQGVDFT
jgi:cellulose synthase/poly-beta-1,6-N-acetylglucosamine synthase-like glycosyltransferase